MINMFDNYELEKITLDTYLQNFDAMIKGLKDEFKMYLMLLDKKLERIQKSKSSILKNKMINGLFEENEQYINNVEVLLSEFKFDIKDLNGISEEIQNELQFQKKKFIDDIKCEIEIKCISISIEQ